MIPDKLHNLYAYSSDVEQAIKKMESMLVKPNRSIIGLSGGPGSGKSTLARYLYTRMKELYPNQVACLSMDGFHLTKQALAELPNAEEAFSRRGAPWTFDTERFIQKTRSLKDIYLQQDVLWPSFDHRLGDPIENDIIISKDTKIILIEGLYLLHKDDGWQESAGLMDQHWFLDTPLELAFERLAQRHMQAFGCTRDQAMSRIQNSDCINAKTVFACKSNADWHLTI
ncbi:MULTISPECIES: AAA family ATPase [Marinomonas]|uniref:AAA family ATPase n=1 Tax=Marinomonas TaxID=28253 RepID=UPI001055A28A|nr:AAA family ATPase [Marinomonas flavescens]